VDGGRLVGCRSDRFLMVVGCRGDGGVVCVVVIYRR